MLREICELRPSGLSGFQLKTITRSYDELTKHIPESSDHDTLPTEASLRLQESLNYDMLVRYYYTS